jgi:hypothetical protein
LRNVKDAEKAQQRNNRSKYTFWPSYQVGHPSKTETREKTLFGDEESRPYAAGASAVWTSTATWRVVAGKLFGIRPSHAQARFLFSRTDP